MIQLKRSKSLIIKLALALLFLFVVSYSIAWFYLANKFEAQVKNLQYKTENILFSFSDAKISGFPFWITAKLKDIKFNYNKNLKASESPSLDFLSDSLEVKTNILFNKIRLTLPKESLIKIFNNKNIIQIKIQNDNTHYLELKEKSFFNTNLILSYLKTKDTNLFKNISLKKAIYNSTNLKFINASKDKEIMSNSADLELSFSYKKDKVSGIALKSYYDIKFIESEFIGHKFKNFSSIIAIDTEVKPYGSILAFTAANFNMVKLKIDDSFIQLNGISKLNEDSSSNTDMVLKLHKLQDFIDNLSNQKIISQERIDIIKELVKQTTGNDTMIDNLEVKIYNTKENEIRIGQISSIDFKSYLHRFMASN